MNERDEITKKPLKDWTLGELQEFCRQQEECLDCCFYEDCCIREAFCVAPSGWKLNTTPRWTEDEIALAKILSKAGGDAVERVKLSCKFVSVESNLFLCVGYTDNPAEPGFKCTLPEFLFPSLEEGQRFCLEDIAKE